MRQVRGRIAVAMVAAVAVVAALAPSARAVAPELNSVAVAPGLDHPVFGWSLPAGSAGPVWADHIVVSRSNELYGPDTFLHGELLDRYWFTFNVLSRTQTSFLDEHEYSAGRYYAHVAGHDPACKVGCDVIEYSNIVCFDFKAGPAISLCPTPAGAGGGGGGGGGADKVAPSTKLRFRRTQDVDKLYVEVTTSETARISASAAVKVGKAARTYRFKAKPFTLPANGRTKVRLRLAKKKLRLVKRALRGHRKLKARVRVTATDRAGNKRVRKATIRIVN